ncbi:uncharacterized protein LOC120320130 isoform X1 [Crotalus tigris]|uniref:uncharacterized protein LOC120320130 isoform X1 n=2 Tax=Crotalus tigris TaxID=88082 RepID=UPI00192F62C4|nr:uncharacterized protein LOC120320130 isoform X1 [Crotalus tigris]
MAAGRGGRPSGGFPVAGLLLLLPGALLSFLPRATPYPSVTHRYENVKVVEISVQPTAVEEIVSEGKDSIEIQLPSNTGEIAAKKEEQTLNDLVNLLQDVVKNIPTELVLSTEKPPTLLAPDIVTSPSVAVDTVWVNVSPQSSEKPRTIALMKKDAPTTTAFWKLRNDPTASVILHSNTNPSENLPSETSESVVLISEEASPGNTLGTISIQVEKEATTKGEGKSFDQLTNGALASLVESLKNVQKLHMTLDNNEPQQKSHPVKLAHHKPRGLDILEAIDTLIKSIKNAPSSVKEDPALREYVEEAEGYLKNALELAGEAERKLLQKKEQQMKLDIELLNPPSTAPPITEMKLDIEVPSSLSSEASEAEIKLDVEITPSPSTVPPATQVGIDRSPSPSTAPSVTEVDIILPASESLEKKAEDTEKEMGKLKAFINLLYGFSPELTEYIENSPHKKMAQDIVERSMEVLDAIKSVFCENPKKQSKQILKQLLQKDMELVRQAMKEKRAS